MNKPYVRAGWLAPSSSKIGYSGEQDNGIKNSAGGVFTWRKHGRTRANASERETPRGSKTFARVHIFLSCAAISSSALYRFLYR